MFNVYICIFDVWINFVYQYHMIRFDYVRYAYVIISGKLLPKNYMKKM